MLGSKVYFCNMFYNLNVENLMREREREREREINRNAKEERSRRPIGPNQIRQSVYDNKLVRPKKKKKNQLANGLRLYLFLLKKKISSKFIFLQSIVWYGKNRNRPPNPKENGFCDKLTKTSLIEAIAEHRHCLFKNDIPKIDKCLNMQRHFCNIKVILNH